MDHPDKSGDPGGAPEQPALDPDSAHKPDSQPPHPGQPVAGWMLPDGRFVPAESSEPAQAQPAAPAIPAQSQFQQQPQQQWPVHVYDPRQMQEQRARAGLTMWGVFLLIAAFMSLCGGAFAIYVAAEPPVRENYTSTQYQFEDGGGYATPASKSTSMSVPELKALALELRDKAMQSPQLWVFVACEVLLALLAICAFFGMYKAKRKSVTLAKLRVLFLFVVYLPILAWFMQMLCMQTIEFHEIADAYYSEIEMGFEDAGGITPPIGGENTPSTPGSGLEGVTIADYFKWVYIIGFVLIATPALLFNLILFLSIRRRHIKDLFAAQTAAHSISSVPAPTP